MHRNQPRQPFNQAILARVKKEMDEPRMAESTREGYDPNHTTLQELENLEKSAVTSTGGARTQGATPEEGRQWQS